MKTHTLTHWRRPSANYVGLLIILYQNKSFLAKAHFQNFRRYFSLRFLAKVRRDTQRVLVEILITTNILYIYIVIIGLGHLAGMGYGPMGLNPGPGGATCSAPGPGDRAEFITYTGNFMVLTKSDLDETTYADRKIKYIDPVIEIMYGAFYNNLRCDFKVLEWNSIEVINEFDLNGDGISMKFKLEG